MEEEYYDDEYQDEGFDEDAGFNEFFQEQLQRTPWWLISMLFHLILGFIATLIVVQEPIEEVKLEFTTTIEPEKIEKVKPEPKRDVFKKTKPVKQDEPTIEDPVVKEAEVSDHHETADNEEFQMSKGQEDAASDSPFEGKFDSSLIGAGGGAGGKFGSRFGGKRNLVKKGGGSELTESAVKAGLMWLKYHQSDDGKWDGNGFDSCCGKDGRTGTCGGAGGEWVDPGVSGLALLCFLGAGNSTTVGEFKDVVKRGVRYLKSIQREDGLFGSESGHYMYNHSIAALAMAEAYAISDYSPLLKESAQKGIDYLVKAQNPKSAWRYRYQSGDNDTSVTGWCTMALKSAKVGELDVPLSAFEGAINWVDSVTDEAYYRTGYREKGDIGSRLQGVNDFAPSEAMTAAGMTSRVFAGADRNDPKLIGGAGLLSNSPPVWGDNGGKSLIDFYYWYYGTLAMYQMGGEYWTGWNDKMKTALVENQKRGGCEDGSWDPIDPWGRVGGRVYSTAVNVLSLEIYYRYSKVFK